MKTLHKPQFLTREASSIMTNRRGYRDDTLFARNTELTTDRHDPCDVVFTEIIGCGKLEICDFILLHYQDILSRIDYRFLTDIVQQIKAEGYPTLTVDGRDRLRGIVRRLCGACDYCVWLCESPDNICDYYLREYIPRALASSPDSLPQFPEYSLKLSLSRQEYIASYITEYELSDDAVLLCDLGVQGVLAAMRRPRQET